MEFILIGCSETRTVSARLVLVFSNAAVHTGVRELEFSLRF